ncbi:MAG: DoxX family protein [Candidatus Tectomicrobia bacterium]|nr:DoxX family protein [Candidatus Tectomicrobia bacterium]
MNPYSDAVSFLMRGGWPIYTFWLLLLGSITIALINLSRDPEQWTISHLWMGIARLFIGGLWWQQTLWKLPPTYTDNPDGVSGGLHYWVEEMIQHAAFGLQSTFVKEVIQAHFYFFAPQVYMTEVVIAISLMLGLFTRAGGVLGVLMALNLWLGLYRAPYEWPWTYFFLILLQVTFVVFHAGRSLGIDAILARRELVYIEQEEPKGVAARLLALLT